MNNKGLTLVELICVLLIIGVITVSILPRLIDLTPSAERKLAGMIIAEMNAREILAWADCKIEEACVAPEVLGFNDLEGVRFEPNGVDAGALIFDGGGEFPVYASYTDTGRLWSDTELVDDTATCPEGYEPKGKSGKCKPIKIKKK